MCIRDRILTVGCASPPSGDVSGGNLKEPTEVESIADTLGEDSKSEATLVVVESTTESNPMVAVPSPVQLPSTESDKEEVVAIELPTVELEKAATPAVIDTATVMLVIEATATVTQASSAPLPTYISIEPSATSTHLPEPTQQVILIPTMTATPYVAPTRTPMRYGSGFVYIPESTATPTTTPTATPTATPTTTPTSTPTLTPTPTPSTMQKATTNTNTNANTTNNTIINTINTTKTYVLLLVETL